jgi:tyrosyl-tRNA synthetase
LLNLDKNLFEEVVTESEFDNLSPGCTGYYGVEPSGIPHIGHILVIGDRISKMLASGIKMKILLADWHAMVNDKFQGNLEEIRESGNLLRKAYEIQLSGLNPEFVWASDIINSGDYMEGILKTAKQTTLSRLKRALPIMGRTENDAESDFSKYIYPVMQVNDIFYLDVDVALGGMDQRHAHMLARDIADRLHRKKVVSLHTPLIGSLKGSGRMDVFSKMSKSDPDSAILITDTPDEIQRKIKSAFCPMGISQGNPLMDIMRIIILSQKQSIIIHRPEKKGGDIEIFSYKELETLYNQSKIHPMDLKDSVANNLIELLKPFKNIVKD